MMFITPIPPTRSEKPQMTNDQVHLPGQVVRTWRARSFEKTSKSLSCCAEIAMRRRRRWRGPAPGISPFSLAITLTLIEREVP